MRTPCSKACPLPPPPPPRLSRAPPPPDEALLACCCDGPNPGVIAPRPPFCPRGAKPLVCDELPLLFNDSRSVLDVEFVPDPGASWLSGLSIDADDPPMNMSVSTRAIWRASPYLIR